MAVTIISYAAKSLRFSCANFVIIFSGILGEFLTAVVLVLTSVFGILKVFS